MGWERKEGSKPCPCTDYDGTTTLYYSCKCLQARAGARLLLEGLRAAEGEGD